MTDITITGKVAARLQELANNTHRSVEEILEAALDTYTQREEKDISTAEPPTGSLARMAWVAMQNPIEVDATDIAERSRDILRSEYTDHLLKRREASDDAANE